MRCDQDIEASLLPLCALEQRLDLRVDRVIAVFRHSYASPFLDPLGGILYGGAGQAPRCLPADAAPGRVHRRPLLT